MIITVMLRFSLVIKSGLFLCGKWETMYVIDEMTQVQNKKEPNLPAMEEAPIPKPKLEDGKLTHISPLT